VGKVPYGIFLRILQISSVHVYLTYPFVLSWSLLEAMSVGCAIVASDTQPVREAITDNEIGILVDFFDHVSLAEAVAKLLESPSLRKKLGENARRFAIANYDLQTVCLPKQLKWVEEL
jgi:glycosyltransferase involved in cell wall biosynthesis